jgi:magnesium-transporting ATPase (P-type)
VLKNTKFVVGVIVYVGRYTKSMMNSTGGTLKMSKLERKVNFYMIFIFGLQFLLILLCGLLRIYLFYSTPDGLTYFTTVLKQTPRNYALEAVLTSCSYFILLNTMIPISLLVSIEIVKFGQGMFINYDKLISRT